MNLDPPFLYNPLNKNEETYLINYSETVEFYTRSWNDISQLIPWICLHKGHRYELRPAIPVQPSLWTKMNKSMWFITRKLLSSTQGFEMISPNSFCGFIFARAIDMDL